MYLGFALDSSDIGLSDTDLDLLDTGINSKYFVGLQDIFQTSLRRLQDQQMFAGKVLPHSLAFFCTPKGMHFIFVFRHKFLM